MRREERGAATVLLVAGLCVGLVAFLGALGVVRFAVARAEVSAAADLAALAAAGPMDCTQARATAHDNGAELVSCEVYGADVEEVVGRELELAMGRTVRVTAWARAGPP